MNVALLTSSGTIRNVNDCPHHQSPETGSATCRLLAELLNDTDPAASSVSSDLCRACCCEPVPRFDQLNSAVASAFLELWSSTTGGTSIQTERLLERAKQAIPVAPPEFPPLGSLIDFTINVDALTTHVDRHEPFVLLRYGDGEWLSMLGASGHNCDGHDFYPSSMGSELIEVISKVAKTLNSRIYIGTTTQLGRQSEVLLSCLTAADRITWVSDAILRLGIVNLQMLRLLRACQSFHGVKVIVGNQHLRPVARALDAHHIVIPTTNCYLNIDEIEQMCRDVHADMVLSCASMASECLLWRLFEHRPNAIYADCGSIFDAMLGRAIRGEYREWSHVISEHYAPFFRPFRGPEDFE